MAHAGVIDLARAIRESNGVEVTVLRPVVDDRASAGLVVLLFAQFCVRFPASPPGATRPEQRERDMVATGLASQARHDIHSRQFLQGAAVLSVLATDGATRSPRPSCGSVLAF